MNAISVTLVCDLAEGALEQFLRDRGLSLNHVESGREIPASYWGAPEAGIIGSEIHARDDTPVHSVLHTACHYLCMDEGRRAALHTDCGGTDLEESAVCYLQSMLANDLDGYSRDRLWADMDAWGYSFRLGSAKAWFEQDAEDARRWLQDRKHRGQSPFLPGAGFDLLLAG